MFHCSIKVLLVLLCLLFFHFSRSNNLLIVKPDSAKTTKPEDKICLEINGTLTFNGKKLDGLEVFVYSDGEAMDAMASEVNSKLSIKFIQGRFYSLVIKKKGFVPALIIVSTQIPKEVELRQMYNLNFEYEMIPEDNHLNKEFTDYPAATISYRKAENKFTISETYNNYIRKSLENK